MLKSVIMKDTSHLSFPTLDKFDLYAKLKAQYITKILKIYTTLGYIVSLILLNLGHVFRFRIGKEEISPSILYTLSLLKIPTTNFTN